MEAQKSFENKIVEALSANLKYVLGGLALVVVAWGVYVAYGAYNQKREVKAQNQLFSIDLELEKKQQEVMTAEALSADAKSKTPPKPPEKNPEALAKNYGSFVGRYESFIKDHQGTKASMVASISLADLYLDHKDPAKAVAVLEPLVKQTRSSDLFFGLLSSQLGVALSDAGQCEKAVEIFEEVLKSKAQAPFHSQTLLRQGACYVTLNRFGEAKTVFEKARTEYPGTFTGEMAQGYERLVTLKKNAGGQ